jgi:DNA-binding NtrC family response regulator
MRILVVDDEPVVAETLGIILTQAGYEVETFIDPEMALESLQGKPAGLVLTDMRMPKMNGIELANRISDLWPACPVIILSGARHAETAGRLPFDWSPYEVLYKPFHPNDLLFVVARIQRAAA